MALLNSAPATVSVTSFPYPLPTSAGQVVMIGTNLPVDVRPSTHSIFDWNFACFAYYGGGAFIDDYSVGGAWAVAGSGGHNVPPNVDCCLFDFNDATWKRIPNANGVPNRNYDYSDGEISSGEIAPGVPAPSHQYLHQSQIRAAQGGGTKGSYIVLRCAASGATGNNGAGSYAFNMATGLWTKRAINTASITSGDTRASIRDSVTNRYYMTSQPLGSRVAYLDPADWTWRDINHPSPSSTGGFTKSSFIDQPHRLLIVQDTVVGLRAMDLNNMTAGWTNLSVSGSFASWHAEIPYVFYPPDGCYYHCGVGGTSSLTKITPPAVTGNPFSGTWVFSQVSLSSTLALAPGAGGDTDWLANNSHSFNRLFYVPSIQRLAWIAGNSTVALIKPS